MVNGCGNKYLGQDDFESDGSYITTEWTCLLWIPIYPVASYRVYKKDTKHILLGTSTNYQVKQVPLNRKQVKEGYTVLKLLLFLLVFFIGVMMLATYLKKEFPNF